MVYQSYEEIAQLDNAKQRHVLEVGDAVERVWAAWAIGLSQGARALPELLSSLDKSPDPGTRRHLLVILAGLGEREALRVLAEGDPDQYVRATACQYLIRTADLTDSVLRTFLRKRALADPASVVKQALLAEPPNAFTIFSLEDFARFMADDDLEVRQLATERLTMALPLDQLFPGLLEDHIEREQNKDLQRYLMEMCVRAGGASRLVKKALTLVPERRQAVLSFLVEQKVHLGWHQLAPLAQLAEPAVDTLVVQLLELGDTLAALPWLLDGFARHAPTVQSHASSETSWHFEASWGFLWRAEQLLIAASPQMEGLAEGSLARDMVLPAIAYLEWASEDYSLDDDYNEQELVEWLEPRARLIAILKRAAAVR